MCVRESYSYPCRVTQISCWIPRGLCSSIATTFNTPLLVGGPSSVRSSLCKFPSLHIPSFALYFIRRACSRPAFYTVHLGIAHNVQITYGLPFYLLHFSLLVKVLRRLRLFTYQCKYSCLREGRWYMGLINHPPPSPFTPIPSNPPNTKKLNVHLFPPIKYR